ncbi:PA-phosphatase [Flavobacterium sp. 9AF]|uniref:phosphatase PAP2 family protein n=1 Tax=Flavobacterium sp. 9AF TaxID=2653142 RepID=UPI0012F23E8D|nr:phosphatase PAP2 family protein [Flavobacterium sp. 9AF]VXC28467.1 PA-phosphatase [Flavobacterium sp. 9AF]
MKKIYTLLNILLVTIGLAQNDSPYNTDWLTDGSIIVGTAGVNALGLSLIKNKEPLSQEKLNQLNSNDIWFVDKWSAGYYDEKASSASDIPLYTSLAIPFLFALNKDTREHSGQLSVMYVEAVGIPLAVFTISSAVIEKSRPKVYNTDLSLSERLESNNQRSFFSGHVAAAAASTFFAAQVYSDFYPDSKAKPYIWAGAAILPAAVAYYRVKGGNHFLSDAALGYILGATSGILVPKLHKRKLNDLKITPEIGLGYQGIGINYTF